MDVSEWTKTGRSLATGVVGAALFLFAAGCSEPVSPETSGACLASVQVQGQLFSHAPNESVPDDFVPADPVATVQRVVGCPDTPSSTATGIEKDGDALGFPVGAPIYALDGMERLTAQQGSGEFIVLAPEN